MNSEQLHYFQLAYEEGNFSAAARRVPVSPQGLAKAIHALEKELGVPLFEADEATGLPRPTEFANELSVFAAVYDSNVRLLGESFDRIRGRMHATVRLEAALGITGLLGPTFFDDYQAAYPNIELQYREANDGQVSADLRANLCDLALMVGPFGAEVTAQELYRCPVYLWVRTDDPLASKKSLSICDLAGRNVALPGTGFKCYERLRELAARDGVSLGHVFQMSEIFQLYEFAASGRGLGFTVGHLVNLPVFVRDASVVALPVDGWDWSFGIERLNTHALTQAEATFWSWCEMRAQGLAGSAR